MGELPPSPPIHQASHPIPPFLGYALFVTLLLVMNIICFSESILQVNDIYIYVNAFIIDINSINYLKRN